MRSIAASRKRWDVLFADDNLRLDLRQAVKAPDTDANPCEDGLRSVCWKAFLLYGPVSQASWPRKLSDSRSAYASLRDHFLRYIDHPDDLESTTDPLTDDDTSPWNQVRRDEVNREEIFQDVTRCMQDNDFFREPSTQKMLLDILFIYSKLHPDVGYRQGMHELLAPTLWVIHCDALELSHSRDREAKNVLMMQVLDNEFIEHDTFSLFCAVMQTAKSFYEIGDSQSPIVERSQRIQNELLGSFDPDLAMHLKVIEILPQIYLLRWLRLLFGREFGLTDTLSVWDVLFSENLSLSLVDMACVAMLLRIRWQLLDADYVEALQLLLHYPSPQSPNGPTTLVEDAIFLDHNRTSDAGSTLIFRHSGRRPISFPATKQSSPRRPPALQLNQNRRNNLTSVARSTASPGRSPGRFLAPQKGLENLFQEVSGNLQKKTTEGWKVARTVREVVRRNMSGLQSSEDSPRSSFEGALPPPLDHPSSNEIEGLRSRISVLETRNKLLAKMMGDALEELREQQQTDPSKEGHSVEETLNVTLAKLQFVQVYLADPEIPIPTRQGREPKKASEFSSADSNISEKAVSSGSRLSKKTPIVLPQSPATLIHLNGVVEPSNMTPEQSPVARDSLNTRGPETPKSSIHVRHQQRPPLAQSPLSWMLGDGHHRSDFVTSASPPPEQRRDSVPKIRPKTKMLFPDAKGDIENKDKSDSEDDGFNLDALRGGRS